MSVDMEKWYLFEFSLHSVAVAGWEVGKDLRTIYTMPPKCMVLKKYQQNINLWSLHLPH